MGFAQNLEYLKEQLGLSNYRLAKDLACSQTSLANWLERGMVPHPKTRQRIADYFGITLEALDGDALPALPPEGEKSPAAQTGDGEREQLLSAIDRALFDLTEEQKLEALRYIWRLQGKSENDD